MIEPDNDDDGLKAKMNASAGLTKDECAAGG
jgi:hypothetical protein